MSCEVVLGTNRLKSIVPTEINNEREAKVQKKIVIS